MIEKESAPSAPKVAVFSLPPEKVELSVHELVAKHVAEAKDGHSLVVEHAERRQLAPWKVAALVARFKAEGLHHLARISDEAFDAALDEALHGRI